MGSNEGPRRVGERPTSSQAYKHLFNGIARESPAPVRVDVPDPALALISIEQLRWRLAIGLMSFTLTSSESVHHTPA
jgi:hypothetical protein